MQIVNTVRIDSDIRVDGKDVATADLPPPDVERLGQAEIPGQLDQPYVREMPGD
jgi:hypothetical protein